MRFSLWPVAVYLGGTWGLIGAVSASAIEPPSPALLGGFQRSACFTYLPQLVPPGAPSANPIPRRLASLPAQEQYFLLRPLPTLPEVQDLAPTGGNTLRSLRLAPLTNNLTAENLAAVLGEVPVKTMLVKPGHLIVRDPGLVRKLSSLFSSGESELSQSEGKMVLNVVTAADGTPLRVEVREAHHRLLAYHLAHPAATVADLAKQVKELEWLVNGSEVGKPGQPVPNKVPLHAVPLEEMGDVDVHLSQKAATFKTSSNNWELGARSSVEMAAAASTGKVSGPKVAYHYIPVSLGPQRLKTHLIALAEQGRDFSQIILVPEQPPTSEQLEILRNAADADARWNLYVAPVERDFHWPGEFYRETMRMRLNQLVAGEPPVLEIPRN